eukprot:15465047-Alexandrium_andersonii.AAC.1
MSCLVWVAVRWGLSHPLEALIGGLEAGGRPPSKAAAALTRQGISATYFCAGYPHCGALKRSSNSSGLTRL